MIRFFKIKFNLTKKSVDGCISVKADNKIEAIIIANKRAIDISVDLQIQEIIEITDDEYFDHLKPSNKLLWQLSG